MKNRSRFLLLYLVPVLVFAFLVNRQGKQVTEGETIHVNQLITYLESGQVREISTQGQEVQGVLKNGQAFESFLPQLLEANFYSDYLKEPIEEGDLVWQAQAVPGESLWIRLLPSLLSLVLLLGFWIFMMRRMQGGAGGAGNGGANQRMMNFGRSSAKLLKEENLPKISFDDVAGLVEEKEELSEIVDFLKDPKKYIHMGARIPKGVLLVGPPGTGKTYLSKAVAGEAQVPFFSISGSDFVEMFVGVGASRVRDLFQEAKSHAPCIVFIDEIDAVGRKRGAGLGGGHDEREQTLNQLLVEMDGFASNEGIIVMAATNRPDILDPAILRPGRFDREVFIGLPDVRAREAILRIHTKNKPLKEDVDLAKIAKVTAGFTPADLENLSNEAALLTARLNEDQISAQTFEEAAIKVVAGPEKKSAVVIEKERVLTAYHEAGHAIVSRLLPEMDQVHLITIVPRGMAGGFTAYLPQEEKSYRTKNGLRHQIISLLGGRAAEELVLDDISTGASNDIERATKLAKDMVTRFGMSKDLGPLAYETQNHEVFLGNEIGTAQQISEKTLERIDSEVQGLVKKAYQKTLDLLRANMDLLHAVSKELLEVETMDGDRFEQIYQAFQEGKALAEPPEELRQVQKLEEETRQRLQEEGEQDE